MSQNKFKYIAKIINFLFFLVYKIIESFVLHYFNGALLTSNQ